VSGRVSSSETKTDRSVDREIAGALERLRDHALERLPAMWLPEAGLFSFRMRPAGRGWTNEGTSLRYTAIVAVGLAAAARHGVESPVPLERIADSLERHGETDNPGDRGLVTWALASLAKGGSGSERPVASALEGIVCTVLRGRSKRPRRVDTMELAWTLLGLLEARSAGLRAERMEDAIQACRRDLKAAQHPRSGLFAFERREAAGGGSRTKRLSFFAEQVYGILALVRLAETTGDEDALDRARRCAARLVRCQWPHGGWPWRYRFATGAVAEPYPFYSVHQDGMAPMALFALERAGGGAWREPVHRGLRWLFGENELGRPLADFRKEIVWRSLRRRGPLRWVSEANKALALVGLPAYALADRILPFFEIQRQTRSYHLGWILTAWAAWRELTTGENGAR
jgi:hypothetical protein